jgi:hypothetical protein
MTQPNNPTPAEAMQPTPDTREFILHRIGWKLLKWTDPKGNKCEGWKSPDGKQCSLPPNVGELVSLWDSMKADAESARQALAQSEREREELAKIVTYGDIKRASAFLALEAELSTLRAQLIQVTAERDAYRDKLSRFASVSSPAISQLQTCRCCGMDAECATEATGPIWKQCHE